MNAKLPHAVFWSPTATQAEREQAFAQMTAMTTMNNLVAKMVENLDFVSPYASMEWLWTHDMGVLPCVFPGPVTAPAVARMLPDNAIEGQAYAQPWGCAIVVPMPSSKSHPTLPHPMRCQINMLATSAEHVDEVVVQTQAWWKQVQQNPMWLSVGAQAARLMELDALRLDKKQHLQLEQKCKVMSRLSQATQNASNLGQLLQSLWDVLLPVIGPQRMSWWFAKEASRTTIKNNTLRVEKPSVMTEGEHDAVRANMISQRFTDHQPIWALHVPVSDRDHIVGVFTIHRPVRRFDADEIDMVEFAANFLADCMIRWTISETLERAVVERTKDLQSANQALRHEIDERRRAEQLQTCLFQIAKMASDINKWPMFYEQVHASLGTILPAKNMYIALLNESKTWLEFPYVADEKKADHPNDYHARPWGHGLSEYVIKSQRPHHLTNAQIEELAAAGHITRHPPLCSSWMGAPLFEAGDVFGVMVVQSYDDERVYNDRDADTLFYVAQQVANGIARNKALAKLHEAYNMLEMRVVERTKDLRLEIMERQKVEEKLHHEAHHDSLTSLPNRKFLQQRLHSLLATKEPCALLFIDIDHFKQINDSLGHGAGDEVLRHIATRLRHHIRPSDIVARLSGDEFVVVMQRPGSPQDVEDLAYRLLAAQREPIALDSGEVVVSCSIGWFMCPHQDDKTPSQSPLTADTLLRNADMALYRAKRRGRQRVERFSDEDEKDMMGKIFLEHELRQALATQQFFPVFQPIVDMAAQHIIGYEALARWRHPDKGVLLPHDFLETAVCSGMVEMIDWQIYDQALAWAATHLAPDQYIAINVSARHFVPKQFVSSLHDKMNEHHLAPQQVHIELNETTLFEANDDTAAVFDELIALGTKIALDDFGSGFSSLHYLTKFPIHIIKIDQSFVEELEDNPERHQKRQEIIKAMVAMADALGMDIVAEGVSNLALIDMLLSLGCTKGQGFVFGKGEEA